ncbi:unnamed protein product, partial [Diplocarpon coronariae]
VRAGLATFFAMAYIIS